MSKGKPIRALLRKSPAMGYLLLRGQPHKILFSIGDGTEAFLFYDVRMKVDLSVQGLIQ